MRGVPAWQKPRSVQHPSSVLALRANPPSPTRGEGKMARHPFLVCNLGPQHTTGLLVHILDDA
ncbi:MAG: hypothetical protein E5Y67_36705, partial [Mesorhizobium sp.]